MKAQLTEKSRVFINPQWSGRGAERGPCAAFVRLPDKGQQPELNSVEDLLRYGGEVIVMDYLQNFRPKKWADAMEDLLKTAKGNFTVVWIPGLLGGEKKIVERDAAAWIAEIRRSYAETAQKLHTPGGYIQAEEEAE